MSIDRIVAGALDVVRSLGLVLPKAVSCHSEGARIALRELAVMILARREGEGRELVTDRRSRLCDVLDARFGKAGSPRMTHQTAKSALRASLAAGLVREAQGRESFRSAGNSVSGFRGVTRVQS
jgi:hypothetical protein